MKFASGQPSSTQGGYQQDYIYSQEGEPTLTSTQYAGICQMLEATNTNTVAPHSRNITAPIPRHMELARCNLPIDALTSAGLGSGTWVKYISNGHGSETDEDKFMSGAHSLRSQLPQS
ncbi:hypothetical protein HAX54_049992 [Datura stramonium]|uniref:Uncharacterized protein n=1 Tax=Datura stramonium TaxID=4076 RepID=A0ABS8SW25_DATST|nr:hypothetical protein [Datura stramonium]